MTAPEVYLTTPDATEGQVVRVLREARALIAEPKHWKKGIYGPAKTWCAVSAIGDASRSVVGGWTSFHEATDLVGAAADWTDRPLYVWNDAPERTHAEVIAAFDAAIERALFPQPVAAIGGRS